MNTALVGIPAVNVAESWESIRHLVGSACARSNGKYEAVDILKALLKGDMQLWGAVGDQKVEAIAIGEIVNYPRIKVYRMLAATGDDMKEWFEHIREIEQWSKIQGCADFEVIARPGWEKVLKNDGYKKTHSILNKNLDNGTIN